jgi:hypothetical protein
MQENALNGIKRLMRSEELNSLGLDSRMIKEALQIGRLRRISRGLYLPIGDGNKHEDIAVACALMPEAVVCLETALEFHDLTNPRAQKVTVAVPVNSSVSMRKLVYDGGEKDTKAVASPFRVSRWNDRAMRLGVYSFQALGVKIKVTDPARTVVDMVRVRGATADRSAEALRDYMRTYQDLTPLLIYSKVFGKTVADAMHLMLVGIQASGEFSATSAPKPFKRGWLPAELKRSALGEKPGAGASNSAAFDDNFDDNIFR